MVQNSSSTLALYEQGGTVGIAPGQSMFVDDGTGAGIIAARNSFVSMLNIILARTAVVVDRSQTVGALTLETPVSEYLIWRQGIGSTQVETLPPATEFDEHVYSIDERDSLLALPSFIASLDDGETIRVLVDGLGNQDAPQWAVWTAAMTMGDDGAEYGFTLTKSYDYHVETLHDRDVLLLREEPPVVGDRILVDSDPLTDGFWTIWQYAGNGVFNLVRHQTYRTTDFWTYADWYAPGYSVTNPPVVRYANAKARDIVENPNPRTTFVRVDDDGTGKWVWTAYLDGAWTVVARQSGTIQLSPKLYEAGRPVIGMDPIQTSDLIDYSVNPPQSKVPLRDGAWELRQIMSAIRDYDCLTDLEINELFFSMVHFCHATQDQVTWAFKTSFLNIGGYNEALKAVPVQPVDNTENLLAYINEVKPYRVKTREFTRIVTPDLDNASVQVSDFDFPPYFDPHTQKWRTLSLDSPGDYQIITTQRPWVDWYNNYQNMEWRAENYDAATWNPVRHFRIKMNFDRVDHMPLISTTRFDFSTGDSTTFNVDVDTTGKLVVVKINSEQIPNTNFGSTGTSVTLVYPPSDGSVVVVEVHAPLTIDAAGYRIQQFYNPGDTDAAEKNLRTLMGLNVKKNVADGGLMDDGDSAFDYTIEGQGAPTEYINPDEDFYGLGDPLHEENRPEELAAMRVDEGLTMNFSADGDPSTFIWLLSMARPGTDLTTPQSVGDYDAVPLNQVVHDTDFVTETGEVEVKDRVFVSVQTPHADPINVPGGQDQAFFTEVGASRTLGLLRYDAYEVLDISNSVTLLSQIATTSNTITVSNAAALTGPTKELIKETQTEITQPGVIWVNGERIEYFEVNGNTLGELRRGTRNTRIGVEQVTHASTNYSVVMLANTVHVTGGIQGQVDGSNRVFTLLGETTTTGLVVSVNEVLRDAQGGVITNADYTGYPTLSHKTLTVDYTARVVGGNVEVTFVKAPAMGSVVFMTLSKGVLHTVNSVVYDGRTTLEDTAFVYY